ncbi:MAG: DegT/DnrJ/EryC1/StrS family aminotransferase [Alphaproteobacteria bacterium]
MNRITDLEKKYVLQVLESGFRTSSGATFMQKFEAAFASKFGASHAISCVNGTATMHAILEAAGVGVGDEVIVPPLTMSATSFAVLQANATPVFADVCPDTFLIDPKSIGKCITDKTKAIITVALYGLSPEIDEIYQIINGKKIFVLEDNAECFGGTYKDKIVGTLGNAASFSFQSSKHLTSGEGGIVLTMDAELANKVRQINSLGYAGVSASNAKISKSDIQHPSYSRHASLGWNYRMPELCCAVALAQTERMEELVETRVKAANIFTEATSDFTDWFVPQANPEHCKNSYWSWVAFNKNDDHNWEVIRDSLLKNGHDGVYAAWKLSYEEPMFKKMEFLGRQEYISSENKKRYSNSPCPVAEYLQPRLFQFKTNYWNLSDAHRQAEIIRKTLKQFN